MSYKSLEERTSYWKMSIFNFCYKHIYALLIVIFAFIVASIYTYWHLSNLYENNIKNAQLLQEYIETDNTEFLQEIVEQAYEYGPYYKLAKQLLDISNGAVGEDKTLFSRMTNVLTDKNAPIKSDKSVLDSGVSESSASESNVESEVIYIKNGTVPFQKKERLILALIGREEEVEL